MARFKVKRKTSPKKVRLGEAITITEKQHELLVNAIVDRLDFGNGVRQNLIERMERIDKELGGYIVLDRDDQERKKDNEKGQGPKPFDVNIQLVDAQIDEAVTYLLSVMAPDVGMYNALAPEDKQEIAQGFARLLNQQAELFGHYAAYNAGFRDMFAYNFGGFIIEWLERRGNKIGNDIGGGVEIKNEIVEAGNNIIPIDPYNFIWDISVPLTALNIAGEFFGTIEVLSHFKVQKLATENAIFGIDRFVNKGAIDTKYFKVRPDIRANESGTSETDWIAIVSANANSRVSSGFEFINYYTWIKPSDFGLSEDNDLQIWRLTLVNSKYVVAAEFLNNAHGMLPVSVSTPITDGLKLQTKSYGERLVPLQRFASFQLNIHQRAARKGLYGLTVFDKQVIALDEIDDLEGGQVPAKPTGQDRDLRKSILFHNDRPDTAGTMDDIAKTDGIAQKLLPTDSQNQVASLERATQYQAAAVVQGSSRRNHKLAKVINGQCMVKLRKILMQNVFQFQESVTLLDDNGREIEIDPAKFRDTKLEFAISDGLKGTDRLLVVESIKEVIRFLLQSPQASQQIDMVSLIDYWTDLLGDTTDFKQFKIESPLDVLPPEQKQIAMQLYQKFVDSQEGGDAAPQGGGSGTITQLAPERGGF